MKRVLLLNADWSPLHFITDTRAITLLYKHKAEQVSEWDETIRSPVVSMKLPATIRLVKYVVKKRCASRFKRRVLFNRDNWTCQYCGEKLNWSSITVDHVQPKSFGGKTSWANCVAACSRCNKKKANLSPEDAGLKLSKKPTSPKTFHFWNLTINSQDWHVEWSQFFRE